MLTETKECHFSQVLFCTCQHEHVSLAGRHGRCVVATHQGEVSQHACLTVDGQVGATAHEFSEWDIPPIFATETRGKFSEGRRTTVTQVTRCLPGGTPLHMTELTQESRNRLAKKSDIKIPKKLIMKLHKTEKKQYHNYLIFKLRISVLMKLSFKSEISL